MREGPYEGPHLCGTCVVAAHVRACVNVVSFRPYHLDVRLRLVLDVLDVELAGAATSDLLKQSATKGGNSKRRRSAHCGGRRGVSEKSDDAKLRFVSRWQSTRRSRVVPRTFSSVWFACAICGRNAATRASSAEGGGTAKVLSLPPAVGGGGSGNEPPPTPLGEMRNGDAAGPADSS